MPKALVLVLSAVGAFFAAKLLAREWRRINDELDVARAHPAPVDIKRESTPLRRDPDTGVYRP
jgi:hypothetical protein